MSYTIIPVVTPEDLADTISLFRGYVASLGIDLTFQDFASEIANMPGKYAYPTGCLFLARSTTNQPIGCVALRSLQDFEICEMKRLYVSPSGRGTGLGKALALKAIGQAKAMGYHRIRLDTLATMTSARALYDRLGFREIDSYYDNPIEGTRFLELLLD